MGSDAISGESYPYRVRFPQDEADAVWLPLLLDAYAALDAGVAGALAAAVRPAACGPGCARCCRQPIPISSLEVLGLIWFVLHQCSDRVRHLLRIRLHGLTADQPCPFLLDKLCAVYPLRPLACREYVVLGRPCRVDERPELTRPEDLLPLTVAMQDRAFGHMLPYYGIVDPARREAALRDRLILRDTTVLQGRDWTRLTRLLA